VKVSYRQSAREDVVRQFRYYLVDLDLPEIAIRFRHAVRRTVELLRQHPRLGPHYRLGNPLLSDLRSWPVAGFEATRIYYLLANDRIHIIRILHGKRDVKLILESETGV
jgi:plasmid stabilization system protein ParE